MKYKESNVPDHLQLRVYYDTKFRNPASGELWTTRAYLIDKVTGGIVARGESRCCPRDNPNRKIGRAIAVGRALLEYHQRKGRAAGLYNTLKTIKREAGKNEVV